MCGIALARNTPTANQAIWTYQIIDAPSLTCGSVAQLACDHRPDHPNLCRERSRALSASVCRSRAGAWVCSEIRRRRAEAETSATARSNASALACEGLLKPESFRTNCSAEAWISSSVAGGSKLNSVLMFRHMISSFARTERHLGRPLKNDPQPYNPTSRCILS